MEHEKRSGKYFIIIYSIAIFMVILGIMIATVTEENGIIFFIEFMALDAAFMLFFLLLANILRTLEEIRDNNSSKFPKEKIPESIAKNIDNENKLEKIINYYDKNK